MAGWSEGGWKNGRRRGVAGKSVWKGGMEEAPEKARNHRILYMPMDWLIDWLIDVSVLRPFCVNLHQETIELCIGWWYQILIYHNSENEQYKREIDRGLFYRVLHWLYQDYFHKVPIVFRDNLLHESHKPYGPSTSVTRLQLLRKQTNTGTSTTLTAETHWRTRTRLLALFRLVTSA